MLWNWSRYNGIFGLFAGKKVSDRKHASTYKMQEEQAKDINELYRNKG